MRKLVESTLSLNLRIAFTVNTRLPGNYRTHVLTFAVYCLQVLNSTHISWLTVRTLLKALPNLEELHLSFNDFHNVSLCEGCEEERKIHEKQLMIHKGIKKLHFTGNVCCKTPLGRIRLPLKYCLFILSRGRR